LLGFYFFLDTTRFQRKTSTGQPPLSADAQVLAVALSMSRARPRDIKKYLYLAGNTALFADDKIAELKLFSSLTLARVHRFGVFSKFLSVDE